MGFGYSLAVECFLPPNPEKKLFGAPTIGLTQNAKIKKKIKKGTICIREVSRTTVFFSPCPPSPLCSVLCSAMAPLATIYSHPLRDLHSSQK